MKVSIIIIIIIIDGSFYKISLQSYHIYTRYIYNILTSPVADLSRFLTIPYGYMETCEPIRLPAIDAGRSRQSPAEAGSRRQKQAVAGRSRQSPAEAGSRRQKQAVAGRSRQSPALLRLYGNQA